MTAARQAFLTNPFLFCPVPVIRSLIGLPKHATCMRESPGAELISRGDYYWRWVRLVAGSIMMLRFFIQGPIGSTY